MQYSSYSYTNTTQFSHQNTLIRQQKIKNMKKTLSGIGFLVFSSELVFRLLSLIFSIFVSVSGITYVPYFMENYIAISESYHGIILFVGIFLVGLIYCLLSDTKISSVITFKKIDKNKFVPYILLGLGIGYFGNIIASYFVTNLETIGFANKLDFSQINSNVFGLVVMTFVTSVTPAFAEEFLFRGVILGKLRKYGDGFAILTSAILFALMHVNLSQIPFAFVGGLFFAFITVKTNSIIPAMIIHFLNNLLSCVQSIISTQNNKDLDLMVTLLSFTIILALCVISFLYLSKKDPKLFSVNNTTNDSMDFTLKEKLKYFFTNKGTVFAIVLLLLTTLLNTNFSIG